MKRWWLYALGGAAAYGLWRHFKSAKPSPAYEPAGPAVDASGPGDVQLVKGQTYEVKLWAPKTTTLDAGVLKGTDWNVEHVTPVPEAEALTTTRPQAMPQEAGMGVLRVYAAWNGKTDKWNLANPNVAGPSFLASVRPMKPKGAAKTLSGSVDPMGHGINYCPPYTSVKC